jgi:hypothetical protein
MTIIIQNDYKKLEVFDNCFTVNLKFNNQREDITIPFNAIIAFSDPCATFELEFNDSYHNKELRYNKEKCGLEKTDQSDKEKLIYFDNIK